ncbi:MAG: sulfite exporter TauE/SafE family protein, partial [Acidimicrobiia bacterium]
ASSGPSGGPLPVDSLELVLALIVTFVAALIQGSIGFGFNILSVPVLALVDPVLAPVPQLVVSFPLALASLVRERDEVDVRGVAWILAGRVPGALVGIGLLAIATDRFLDVLMAAFVLLAVVFFAAGRAVSRSRPVDFTAGVFSGTTGAVASMGGPPLALLFAGEKGPRLRATLAAVFAIGVTMSIAARGAAGEISWDEIVMGGLLIVPAALAFLVSNRLLARVDGAVIRFGVLALSTTAALGLLVRAL